MAPEEPNGDVTEPVTDPQPNSQQQNPTPETGTDGGQQQAPTLVADRSTQLPDDHPLVTAHATVKGKLAAAMTELNEARARAAHVTQLEEEISKRPTQEAVDTLQTRYDRLEQFVLATGLGKALDSRTFTKALFETDQDIKDLVMEWNRANPSYTSQALGSTADPGQGTGKHDPNELLRIAMGKQ